MESQIVGYWGNYSFPFLLAARSKAAPWLLLLGPRGAKRTDSRLPGVVRPNAALLANGEPLVQRGHSFVLMCRSIS